MKLISKKSMELTYFPNVDNIKNNQNKIIIIDPCKINNFNDKAIINNLINEIKKVSKYEIEKFDYENIDDDMIVLGLKLKDFPTNKNKVAYSIEIMNKLDEKLPENIDIFVV